MFWATATSDAAGILRRAMTERELLRTLTEACGAAGLLWYHPPDPRRCSRCGNVDRLRHQAGWPDLAIVTPPVLRLLAQLAACTEVDARIVKPRHLEECIRTLLAGRVR